MKFLVIFSTLMAISNAETLSNCELAKQLKQHQVPSAQIPTWVCIANKESSMNTAAVSESGAYGLFQINSEYWCSGGPRSTSNGCGVTCQSLLDSDLSDDIACARNIYKDSGFDAWAVYASECKNGDLSSYVAGC